MCGEKGESGSQSWGFVPVGVPEAAVSLAASAGGGSQTRVPLPSGKCLGGRVRVRAGLAGRSVRVQSPWSAHGDPRDDKTASLLNVDTALPFPVYSHFFIRQIVRGKKGNLQTQNPVPCSTHK